MRVFPLPILHGERVRVRGGGSLDAKHCGRPSPRPSPRKNGERERMEMTKDLIKTSKFLSLVLRHKPEEVGLVLDGQGWADIGELIERAGTHGMRAHARADRAGGGDQRQAAVRSRPGGQRIRANQGHSVDIDLGLDPASRRRSCFTARPRQRSRPSASRASSRVSGSTCIFRRMRTPPSGWAGGTGGRWCCA